MQHTHIFSDLTYFSEYKNKHDSKNFITTPDGSKIPVKHSGLVKLTNEIMLHNVLHVSLFKFNLNSIHKLCKDMTCELHFTPDECFVSQNEKLIPLGKLNARFYNVQDQKVCHKVAAVSHECNKTCLAAVDDAKLWHLRLGHLSFNKLHFLPISCDPKSCLQDTICEVCPKANQTRVSFPRSSIKTTKSFELHLDVWGPHSANTPSGCNQFFTIVDDFSRFTWIHFLKHKSDSVS